MGYNGQLYQKVREQMEADRRAAVAEADAHRAHLHAISPEAAEIDRTLATTGMRYFNLALHGTAAQISELRRENVALQKARRELLHHLGLPEDYTEPHYKCALCRDSGATERGVCDCLRRRLTLAAFEESGIGSLIRRQSFDNFSLDYYRDSEETFSRMKQNLERCRSFSENFREESGENLLMLGGTGLGKTHLSTAIARRVIERGFDVVYDSAQNILSTFEEEQFRSRDAIGERTGRYFSCDLLIIDDLGVEMNTQFTASCIYNLINTRLNRSRSTVISTNLTQSELRERYNDRIFSRLFGEFTPVLFVGRDVRMQK